MVHRPPRFLDLHRVLYLARVGQGLALVATSRTHGPGLLGRCLRLGGVREVRRGQVARQVAAP